jgi:protoheme IX farnesyltransferase
MIAQDPLAPLPAADTTTVPATGAADTVAANAHARSLPAAYLELTKPGIVRMVLITAAAGYVMASGSVIAIPGLLHALFGMGLVAAGSCGLNQWLEWRIDAGMRRTADRPIPTGQITPGRALAFSSGISVVGLIHLALFVNALTTCLVALSLVTYVAVYTPLKRVTWHNTIIGAIPGALPILAGWTAAEGPFDARGLALFAILFLWQMPHFFALAWMYRKDYRDAGFRMITDNDPAGVRTSRYMVGYGIALLVVSLIPAEVGLVGAGYAAAAAFLGSGFLAFMLVLAASPSDARAVRVFLGSIVYLPLLLLVMVADKLLA